MSLRLLASVPVQPGGAEARGWLLDELAKPPYQAARPTLFDLAAQAFIDWFQSLFQAKAGATPSVLLVVGLLVLLAVVGTAIVLFGLPSRNRRSAGSGALFGEEDTRTAERLRAAAVAAMRSGDWSLAVLERFRAVARGLDERTIVAVFPGTTATAFARGAAGAFDGEAAALAEAAATFDAVRYAGSAATRDQAEQVAELDARLIAARPRLLQPAPA